MSTLSSTLTSYSTNSYKMYPAYMPSPPEKYNPYNSASHSTIKHHSLSVGLPSLPSIETLLPPSPKCGTISLLPELKVVPINQPLSIITDEAYLNTYYDPYYQLPPVIENGHPLLQCSQSSQSK